MKNFIKMPLALLLSLISLSLFAQEPCPKKLINPFAEVSSSTENLRKVVEAVKVRQDLMPAKIKYGFLGVNVGNATIFLTTSEGKIVDLNVSAKVNVAGLVKQDINQRITLNQIKNGDPLAFTMQGSNRGVLIVQPGQEMNEFGGEAELKIWDGEKYSRQKITIKKVNGRFVVMKGDKNSTKIIKSLSVTMSGMSVPSMHVSSYKIKTR